ncbi:hypothetical protein KC853_01070 [Candidatus Saccharibacteria bacterium]|nr:hypothetical protein [Candidatus Saccharibacteria bacterium]MCB9834435.1 hypothetical protein [Candidatus Nomurabacteria bacterium]
MIDLSTYPRITLYIQIEDEVSRSIDEIPIATFEDQYYEQHYEKNAPELDQLLWSPLYLPEASSMEPTNDLIEITDEYDLDPQLQLETIINIISRYYWSAIKCSNFNHETGILEPLIRKVDH